MAARVGDIARLIPFHREDSTTDTTSIYHLPKELILHIFSRLTNIGDLQRLTLVCSDYKLLADDHLLRKKIFEKDFPTRIPIGMPPFSWKNQYRYATQVRENIRNGVCARHTFTNHTMPISCIAESGPLLFSGSWDGTIIIQNTKSKTTPPQVLTQCGEGTFILNQGFLLYKSGSFVNVLKKDNQLTFKEFQTLDCDATNIKQFSMEDDHIFINSEAGALKIWKWKDKEAFQECGTLHDLYHVLAKKDYLFAISTDGNALIWQKDPTGNYQEHSVLKEISPASPRISWLSFEEQQLVAGSFDGTIKIWRQSETGQFIEMQNRPGTSLFDPVTDFNVKADQIILGSLRGNLTLLNKDVTGIFTEFQSLTGHSDKISSMQIEGNYLFTGSIDQSTKIWEKNAAGQFDLVQDLKESEDGVMCIKMQADRFFAGYGDGSVKIWDFTHQISNP